MSEFTEKNSYWDSQNRVIALNKPVDVVTQEQLFEWLHLIIDKPEKEARSLSEVMASTGALGCEEDVWSEREKDMYLRKIGWHDEWEYYDNFRKSESYYEKQYFYVLSRYLSEKCIRDVASIGKKYNFTAGSYDIYILLLDTSYAKEVSSFLGHFVRDFNEVHHRSANYNIVGDVYVERFDMELVRRRKEKVIVARNAALANGMKIAEWKNNSFNKTETVNLPDQVRFNQSSFERGGTHVVVKDGQRFNIINPDYSPHAVANSFAAINDFDFYFDQVRNVRTKEGLEERPLIKFYKKIMGESEKHFCWTEKNRDNLSLEPSDKPGYFLWRNSKFGESKVKKCSEKLYQKYKQKAANEKK